MLAHVLAWGLIAIMAAIVGLPFWIFWKKIHRNGTPRIRF